MLALLVVVADGSDEILWWLAGNGDGPGRWMLLPHRTAVTMPGKHYAQRTMQVAASGRIYVAIVDDDDNQRRSFERLLRAAGMEAITYATAEEFLADGTRPNFDCLVLDVQLPGMSGLKLQEQLSAEQNQAAIVFITAHDDPGYREQANVMGCSGYFRKSDSGREVIDAIQVAVGRRPRNS